MDEARELVSNRLLWPRIRDFLWDFASQVHESWMDDVFSRRDAENAEAQSIRETSKNPNDSTPSTTLRDTNPNLCASATSAPLCENSRVKAWLLKELGVEPCFHAFPKDDGSRLLLLDGATLLEVVKWLGAIACADDLRRVTDGATVRALKSALPGVYPEVFGYTAYFDSRRVAEVTEAQRLEEKVFAVGCGILSASVSNLPASLVSRLKFKLPKNLCDLRLSPLLGHPLCGQPSAGGYASLRETFPSSIQFILKLLKLKFPEAYSICCS